ncbi:probable inactive tRNA-specific adenosine deaminase-like protein 3 isoform X2 [Panulirus ornatus]|uniref:probable inactive tRNA-specific adenosine deaminase-like protein 3 isoform X2 n=1 Tax=Panulirus ornatus TaxID=150431 RepID=UPI003A8A0199
MASSKDFAVLDLQNESQDLGMDLQFQDFGAPTQPISVSSGQHEQTIHFSEFPDSAEDEQEHDKIGPKIKRCKREDGSTPLLPLCPSEVHVAAVLPEGVHGKVDLAEVVVLQVKEKQCTSLAVKELSQKLPVPALSHLKRVRRLVRTCKVFEKQTEDQVKTTHEDYLFVYLNFIEDFGVHPVQELCGDNIMPLSMMDTEKIFLKLKEKKIETSVFTGKAFISRVARYAPRIREMYDKVATYWPCSYHEDTYLTQLSSANFFSENEIKIIVEHMNKAIEMGSRANMEGNPSVGVVIIDSQSGQIVSVAQDHRHEHPLQHAVMIAIDNVARRQGGGAWTQNEFFPSGNPFYGDGRKNASDTALIMEELSAVTDMNNESSCVHKDTKTTSMKTLNSQISCNGSYICTGYDVFMTHEPCMMCAMALLHSRVRRVFYCCPNQHLGALGSVTKLHILSGINHRYEVFTVTPT